jgi:DNA-binding response OmpR family regulator
MRMRVLVVEDDRETAEYICSSLKALGHVTKHAPDGKQGFLDALDHDFDVMVIDRMLPNLDGLSLVKSVRSANVDTPILFLSALGGLHDRVDGLEAGADDYLVKPFAFSELSARLTALARRPPMQAENTRWQVADLEIDLIRHCVSRSGQDIALQPREFRLLTYLMQNAGRAVTRTMLLEAVWDFHFEPNTNVVETHISRLRNKIDKPFEKMLIHTVRGTGYSLHD